MTTRILSAALLLAFAAAASAQVPEPELIERTARAVETYPRYTVFDHVAASIDGGVVTLTGKVTMPIKKDELGKRIEGIAGAGNVRNEIDVLPVSIGDERIRQRTSRAIYGNTTFREYAARPNPQTSDLKIVYTPLHGVGGPLLTRICTWAQHTGLTPVPEQMEPDGAFPTVAFPKPE